MYIKHSSTITKNGTGNLGVILKYDIGNSEGWLWRLGGVLKFFELIFKYSLYEVIQTPLYIYLNTRLNF